VQHLLPKDFAGSPEALSRRYSVQEAIEYTHWLATHHYENFHVVSVLLPRHLHQDFYNVYSFCRWADDLGDEIGDTQESLRLLKWWRGDLHRMYNGEATHPVYVALMGTVQRHNLPRQPFDDLITAFENDQIITRYSTWHDVFEYCKYSANPVGRLVLGLCGYATDDRFVLSDYTCTALQLANFWQDVSVDLHKDRIYIPLDLMAKHGYTQEDLFAGVEDERFFAIMREAVSVARDLFYKGLPLIGTVDRRLAFDLDLFSRGGLKILDKVEQQEYRVLGSRPAISKSERIMLLLRSVIRIAFRTKAA
jgi:squalene synthase HpnC